MTLIAAEPAPARASIRKRLQDTAGLEITVLRIRPKR
jgi:hypothetical protein